MNKPRAGNPVWLVVIAVATALTAPVAAQPLERRVLAVYNSAENETDVFNPIASDVAMVLNYLGLKVSYWDLAQGLPGPTEMQAYRGVLAWLETDRIAAVAAYWEWIRTQAQAGRRVVLFNGPGPRTDATTKQVLPYASVNVALAALSLRLGPGYSLNPADVALVRCDSTMVQFERRLPGELQRFVEVRSNDPRNRVFLQVQRRSTGTLSDAVVLTPTGGIVCEGYVRYVDPRTQRRWWRVNPFAFLSQALGVDGAPRFDCTTLNGARVYYSHIDADGMLNPSMVDRTALSGDVIYQRVLQRRADLPFTASVITAEMDPAWRGTQRAIDMARRIFALPNVEAASHSFSHPLIWNLAVHGRSLVATYEAQLKDATPNGRALLPWNLEGYAFDPQAETAGSCQYVTQHLLPPGKTCRLIQWSGNCLPDEETLAAAARAGVYNINGGDSRLDGAYPSYTNVAPMVRPVGSYWQVYASASNENTYTNGWQGPYGAYQNVLQTFERTESPRRLAPVNVYFHFYSGEREASLGALDRALDWVQARSDSLYPVFAWQYAQAVQGFLTGRIERLADHAWRITDNGTCRTVRFDGLGLLPQLDRCAGVLGYRVYQGSLYVFLANVAEHTLVLGPVPPKLPYLMQATAPVDDYGCNPAGSRLSFRSEALGRARFAFANLPPNAPMSIRVEGDTPGTQYAQTDTRGQLAFTVPLRGAGRLTVTASGPQ
jgi:hypothetical protein